MELLARKENSILPDENFECNFEGFFGRADFLFFGRKKVR